MGLEICGHSQHGVIVHMVFIIFAVLVTLFMEKVYKCPG